MKTLTFNPRTSLNIQGKQYNVSKVIGQGFFGKIYLAELNGVNYTIKEQNQMTEQEFDFCKQLATKKFKNRVNVFALEKNSNGKIYMVMEYCQISLYDKIQQKTFDASQMRFVIKEIANGIKEIHDMGLANRDLTPENILIQEIPILQGNVQEKYKIFDFRTIQQTERLQNKQVGTPYYLAPEQLDGNKNYTLKADIWSLGAICYELLTNKPLFDGITVQEIELKIKTLNIDQEIDKLKNMERHHYDLIKKMLQRNPNQRCDIDNVISNLGGTTRTKSINRVDKVIIDKPQPQNLKNPQFYQQLQAVKFSKQDNSQTTEQKIQNNQALFSPIQPKLIPPNSQSQAQNTTNQFFFNQEQQKDFNLQESVGLNKQQNKPLQFVPPGSIPDTLKNNIDFKVSPQKQLLKNDLNQQKRPPLDIKIQPSGDMMWSPPFSNQGGRDQDKGNYFGIQKSPFKSPNENQFFKLNLQSNQNEKFNPYKR